MAGASSPATRRVATTGLKRQFLLRGFWNFRTRSGAPLPGRCRSFCFGGSFCPRPSPRSWPPTGRERQRRNRRSPAAMPASARMAIPPYSSACARKPMLWPKRALLARPVPPAGRYLAFPVAVKDNIDVAGLPTTAACPAFSYHPAQDATAVARLRAAGAIVIGKTNLDQFATGLVGVRSPYGVPKNLFNVELIPGGSSSGSAVAVAAGLVPLALGTDTAGSGRVPAGFNNIVGLETEPRPGLDLWRGAGLPHTRLRVGVRADRRRCLDRARGHRRAGRQIPMRASARWRNPAPCRRMSNSACRLPASGCFSATANTPPPTKRRYSGWRGSAATSSRSTSSRSTKPRACSMTAPGWPSARSPRARCWRRIPTPFIR